MAMVTSGVFAGMDTEDLQPQLRAAQLALIKLQSGERNVSLSYTQGDGAKSVSKQVATVAECTALIAQLQSALGMPVGRRRGMRFLRL